MKKITAFASVMMLLCLTIGLTACGGDKEPDNTSIVGTWTNFAYDSNEECTTTLKFNSNHTGYVEEVWKTRANHTYTMDFEWSTASDANGNTILTVSKTSGNDEMNLFPGSGYNTVVWQRQYYLTGNTLNITTGEGYVMVFKRD